jgi:hypothetical protein
MHFRHPRARLALGLSTLLVACAGGSGKEDEDIDITDIGDFGDSDGGGAEGDTSGGFGTGIGTDGGETGTTGGTEDGTADGVGTGGTTGGGGDGEPDDGGGGSGSTEPPTPAYAPVEAACDDALDYQIQMLDSVGGACTECASGADHWVAAIIYNPCDTPMDVTLNDGYVIGGLSLENLSTGEGMGMGLGSTGRVVTETIEPGEWLSDAMWMGTLSDGEYSLTVTFFDEAGTQREAGFWVN